jgi:hypothetical protein
MTNLSRTSAQNAETEIELHSGSFSYSDSMDSHMSSMKKRRNERICSASRSGTLNFGVSMQSPKLKSVHFVTVYKPDS